MAVDFQRSDFLTDISDKELTAYTTKLVNAGDPDPIATAIARARAKIADYAERYDLRPDTEKGLICDLGIFYLIRRLEEPDKNRTDAKDGAIAFLKDFRDRKFKDALQKDPVPADIQPYQGRSGGQGRIGGVHDSTCP